MGTALKALGVVFLGLGILGTIGGIGLLLFAQAEVHESDKGLLLSDSGRRDAAEEAGLAGATVLGFSLFGAGVGLVFLVAGIVVNGHARAFRQQQQVVVVTGGPAPAVQTHQRPPTP